jgi:hypothetical protein
MGLTEDAVRTSRQDSEREHQAGRYALRRGLGTWEVTFEGRRDSFRDEQGADYVVWLLLHPPPQPIHAVALIMEARHTDGYTPEGAGAIQQRNLGLDDAEAVRTLRRQARELEAVLEDKRQSEPVRAEARRKRDQIRPLPYSRDSASRQIASWRPNAQEQDKLREGRGTTM